MGKRQGKDGMKLDFDFDRLIEGLDVDLEGLGFDLDLDGEAEASRYMKPRINPKKSKFLTSDTARNLAERVYPDFGERYDCLVSGAFVFGDFIEQLFSVHDIAAKRMTVSTLSLNEDNIASLANLAYAGRMERLDLIVSHYFYANERHGLIPLLYEFLDHNDGFQLAVASTHAKMVLFETAGGRKVVIHGSANLRANGNIEQITIEEHPELYDFYTEALDGVVEKYRTIDKAVRGRELWRAVEGKEASHGGQ